MANADRVVVDGVSYGVGNVASVNGKTGEVVLSPADIGAKAVQSAVSSPSASGTGVEFIDTISQDVQGIITATKKTVREASTSQSGLMTATQAGKLIYLNDGLLTASDNFAPEVNGNSTYPIRAGSLFIRYSSWSTLTDSAGWHLCRALVDITSYSGTTTDNKGVTYEEIKVSDLYEEVYALALAAYPTPTVSGAVASIPDGADGLPVKSLVVDIASAAGVTGATIKRFGKNLLEPFSGSNSYTRGTTVEIQTDGTMRAQGTATAAGWLAPIKTVSLESCGFSVGDTLTISCGANAALVVRFMDSGGSRIRQTATATYGSPVTDTIPAGTVSFTYVYQFGSAQVAVGDVVDITTWFQIERGSRFTGFAAYQSETREVAFPSGAGSVTAGTLDVTGGVLTVGGNTYDVTPLEIDTLLGGNTIFADCGDVTVTYRADPTLYGTSGQTEDDMTANTPIASGKYFQIGNTLYKATAAIATGETIVPGVNCAVTNIAEALNLLNA